MLLLIIWLILVVWGGLVSSFKTDMDIFGQWLDLYYLGEAFDL